MKVGNLAPKTNNFVSAYITPPTQTEGDVTTITGFVQGISISSFEADEDKLILTFSDKDSKNIRKFINNPEKDNFLSERKPDPETWLMNSMFAIRRVAENFISIQKYNELFADPEEEISFEDYVSRLFLATLNKFEEDVLLKVVFQEKEGVYSKFKVADTYWIGKNTDKYTAVKWNEGSYKSSDILQFTKVEKQPDLLGAQEIPFTNTPIVPPTFDLSALKNL